jgi:hypothetical protein
MSVDTPGVRAFYAALGVSLRAGHATNVAARCFVDPEAHRRDDRNPSMSVSLHNGVFRCHGCGAAGGAYDAARHHGLSPRAAIDLMVTHGLIERRLTPSRRTRTPPSAQTRPLPRVANRPRPTLDVSDTDLLHYHAALLAAPTTLSTLCRQQLWTEAVIRRYRLGLHRGRVVIPVTDVVGRLLSVLRYDANRVGRAPKMLAVAGSVRALFPAPASLTARRLLLVEGEPDALAALSLGIAAVAIPGVDAWRGEWASLFAGRVVTICPDCDRQGRALAVRVRNDLDRAAVAAEIFDLDTDRDDGYDLTNALRSAYQNRDMTILSRLRLFRRGLAPLTN